MAILVPVNHNPFETQTSTAKLTPVDYNPFEQAPQEEQIPDRHTNFRMPESSFVSDAADFTKMVAQKGAGYIATEGPDLAKEGAKSFSRGWNTVIPQQTGKAMQFLKRFSDEMLTPKGFENPIQDYARKLLQGAGQAVEGFGDTQQKRLEPVIGMSEKAKNAPWYSPMHMMATGPENAVQSAVPLIAGLATGGPAGVAAGFATLGGLFYGGSAEDKYREAIRQGVDKETAFKLANIEGIIETGGEVVQDAIPLKLFGVASKPIKNSIVKSIASKLGPAEAIKSIGKTIFGEVATEAGQAASQTYFSNKYGVDAGSIKENVLDIIGPTIFMSLLFGGAGTAYNYQTRKDIVDTLSDPKSSDEKFNAVVNTVASSVEKIDKGLAKSFKEHAEKARANGQPVIVGDDIDLVGGKPEGKPVSPEKEKLEIAKFRNQFQKAIDKGDQKKVNKVVSGFLNNENVSPEIRQAFADTIRQDSVRGATETPPPTSPSPVVPAPTSSETIDGSKKEPWQMTKEEHRASRSAEEISKEIEGKAGSENPQEIADHYRKKYNLPRIRVILVDSDSLTSADTSKATLNGETVYNVRIPKKLPSRMAEILRHEIEHIIDAEVHGDTRTKAIGDSSESTFSKYDHPNFTHDYSHRAAVKRAIREGKPVPPEVMKDYPDLAKNMSADGVQPDDTVQAQPETEIVPAESDTVATDEKDLTGVPDSEIIESGKETPSILDRFEEEQQKRLAQRKAGDRRVSIVNHHPVTGMMEGKYASKRLAEFAAETAEKNNVPVVYVEGDLYNLGGLNKKFGQTGADPYFKAMADIAREEFEKLGVEIGFTTKGGDEFGFTVVGATEEQVDDVLDRIAPRVKQYIKDNNLDSIPHTKEGRNPGTGLTFAARQFSPDKYRKAAEAHRKENEIEDEKDFTAVDAWIRDTDLEVEALKEEGGFNDEYREQAEEAGTVSPEGQTGRVEKGVEGIAGDTKETPQATPRESHLATLKPYKRQSTQAYYDYVDSLTDKQRDTVSDLITDTPKSPKMDLAGLRAALKKRTAKAKLAPKKAPEPTVVPKSKQPTPKAEQKAEGKEPWEMTRAEFIDDIENQLAEKKSTKQFPDKQYHLDNIRKKTVATGESYIGMMAADNRHKKAIEQAISEGKFIPKEVLKDYPDLIPEGMELMDKPGDNVKEEPVFIRKPTAKEKAGGTARARGFNTITPKEGYEVVYKPYGNTGNKEDGGYYYQKIEKSSKATLYEERPTSRDARYLELAKDPEANREELQRMVDEAAREAGYDVEGWHGTNQDTFTVFRGDVGRANDRGFYGDGFYFTFGNGDGSKNEASYYGKNILHTYLKLENPFNFNELSEYRGKDIRFIGTESIVFLSNIAKKFPEIADNIFVDKKTWNSEEQAYDIEQVPITILPKLIEDYRKQLKTFTSEDSYGNKLKYGYVKSEMVEFEGSNGKKYTYESRDDLGPVTNNVSDEELEILLIAEALEKHDGIEANYHPEGYMTRHPEITQAIKDQKHDSIIQSPEGDEAVVFNPSQIKSADPVTYYTKDDAAVKEGRAKAGDVIPLSERFDKSSDDIRFEESPTVTDFSGISLAQLKKLPFMRGKPIEINDDGSVAVKFAPGKVLTIKGLTDTGGEVKLNLGTSPTGAVRTAQYQNHEVIFTKASDLETVFHEIGSHFFEDIGLINKGDKMVLNEAVRRATGKRPGMETREGWEARARWIGANLANREQYRGTKLGRILQKVADFVDSLVGLVKLTERGVLRKIEKGNVRGQESGRNIKSKLLQTVWHGTPHVWPPEKGFPHGRPRLDKIGTGEGAQAYGWGWYSAEGEKVGSDYKEKLSRDRWREISESVKLNSDRDAYIATSPDGKTKEFDNESEAKDWVAEQLGSLYKLDIPDSVIPKLLDWDKPLSEQSEYVKNIIINDDFLHRRMAEYRRVMIKDGIGEPSGISLYHALIEKTGSQKAASEYLASIGIPGNRYLDGMSRGKGEGSYNYVIWDQAVLDEIALLERNGEKLDAIREAEGREDSAEPLNETKRNTATAAFKKWFGKSKVVDEDGEPLVVYRGDADATKTTFKTGKSPNKNNQIPFGVHFSESAEIASGFSFNKETDEPSGGVYPVYLAIENPLDISGNNLIQKGTEEYGVLSKIAEKMGKKGESFFGYSNSKQNGFVGEFINSNILDSARGDISRKTLLDSGYDGVIYKAAYYNTPIPSGIPFRDKTYVALKPTQIKSIFNRGTWDGNNPDILYEEKTNPADELKKLGAMYKEKFGPDDPVMKKIIDESSPKILKCILGREQDFKLPKPDITLADRMLNLMSHYSAKVPGLKLMYDAGLGWVDDKNTNSNILFHGKNKDGETISYIENLKRLSKKDKMSYKRLQAYLLNRDRDAVGYRVKQKDDKFDLLKPRLTETAKATSEDAAYRMLGSIIKEQEKEVSSGDRKYIDHLVVEKKNGYYAISKLTHEKISEISFDKTDMADRKKAETEIWNEAVSRESEDVKEKGFSDAMVEGLVSFRSISHNIFNMRYEAIQELIEKYEKEGRKPAIAYKDELGNSVKIDLKVALAEMGDLRGHYFPRTRNQGKWIIRATKKGAQPILEMRDTKATASFRRMALEKQGYTVAPITMSERMPESVFALAGQNIAINELVDKALEGVDSPRTKTLKDIGITLEKDGDDVILKGIVEKGKSREIVEAYGGKYEEFFKRGKQSYTYGGRFRFKGADTKELEKKLTKALFLQKGIDSADIELLFAAEFAEQLANTIKERGARSAMIHRQRLTGKNVWAGYEEDPLTAIARAGQSTASAQAKKYMAIKMINAMKGTTESWAEWRDRMKKEGYQTTDGKRHYGEAHINYDNYLDHVEEQKISATKQKNAFESATKYMQDMLRNDEAIDRVMGTVKGVAVLKYLGFRLAAPAVNMTALVTNVPATMNGYADIPLHRAPDLLAKAVTKYGAWKVNPGSVSEDTQKALKRIYDKGWHKAQFNMEAVNVLKGKFGRGYGRLIDASMAMFGVTEQINRVATILGAYDGIKKTRPELSFEKQMELAKEVSDKAHGTYGKPNYPELARGSGIGGQVLKSAYVFKTFTHNYLATLKELGWDKKNYKAASWLIASPALLAGTTASMVTPAMMKMVNLALKLWDKDEDDPEEALYRWMYENAGENAGKFTEQGLFGLLGLDLKGSLQVNVTDIPTDLFEILGAPGSMIKDIGYGIGDLSQGELDRAFERLLPNAFAAPIKAYRERTEGVTTHRNTPVYWGNEPLKSSALDAWLRALSFNPAELSSKKGQLWREKNIEKEYQERRSKINERIKDFVLKPQNKKTKKEWADIMTDVYEYNQRLKRNNMLGILNPITSKSIDTYIKRTFKPSKRDIARRLKAS